MTGSRRFNMPSTNRNSENIGDRSWRQSRGGGELLQRCTRLTQYCPVDEQGIQRQAFDCQFRHRLKRANKSLPFGVGSKNGAPQMERDTRIAARRIP